MTPRKRKYAPMVDESEPSEDEWSSKETNTEPEPENNNNNRNDSDCDLEAKPQVLCQQTCVDSKSAKMAAKV